MMWLKWIDMAKFNDNKESIIPVTQESNKKNWVIGEIIYYSLLYFSITNLYEIQFDAKRRIFFWTLISIIF